MSDDVVMYLIHPAARERLDQTLAGWGIDMVRMSPDPGEEDDIPVYFMSPKNFT